MLLHADLKTALKRVLERTHAAVTGQMFGAAPVAMADGTALPPVPVYIDDTADGSASPDGPDVVIGEPRTGSAVQTGTLQREVQLAVILTTPRDEARIPGLRAELRGRLQGLLCGTAPDDAAPRPRQHPLAAKITAAALVSPVLNVRADDLSSEPVMREPLIDPDTGATVDAWDLTARCDLAE